MLLLDSVSIPFSLLLFLLSFFFSLSLFRSQGQEWLKKSLSCSLSLSLLTSKNEEKWLPVVQDLVPSLLTCSLHFLPALSFFFSLLLLLLLSSEHLQYKMLEKKMAEQTVWRFQREDASISSSSYLSFFSHLLSLSVFLSLTLLRLLNPNPPLSNTCHRIIRIQNPLSLLLFFLTSSKPLSSLLSNFIFYLLPTFFLGTFSLPGSTSLFLSHSCSLSHLATEREREGETERELHSSHFIFTTNHLIQKMIYFFQDFLQGTNKSVIFHEKNFRKDRGERRERRIQKYGEKLKERDRGRKVSVKLSLCPRSWTRIIWVRKENEKRRREDFHLSFPCHFFSFFQMEWKREK